MTDDWRLEAELFEDANARALSDSLTAEKVGEDLEGSFGDQVIVSVDGSTVFCYTGDRERAERAADLIRSLAGEKAWEIKLQLKRWHPTAEEWEDPDEPLPETPSERSAEHAELVAKEREESRETGEAQFEVRVECASHGDTVELADKLREEGIPNVRRWKYLLIGALDEDSANALAERLRREAPAGAKVTAEASFRATYDSEPLRNSFSYWGGFRQ
jgi:hypothetical protein